VTVAQSSGYTALSVDEDEWQNRAAGVVARMSDPFNLNRFAEAQERWYDIALSELRDGCKAGHWMWFIFPQVAGLGISRNSCLFAIASLDEARAYLHHPLLGERLRACTDAVNETKGRSALEIFGSIDCLKFRSSMTLFAQVAGTERVFCDALGKFFGGKGDPSTLAILGLSA
jgi:uncharacterized protein (DUF1810 family)